MEVHCYRHAGVAAFDTCSGCTQAMCTVCTSMVGGRVFCPPCAQKAHRSKKVTTALVVGLASAAVVGLGVWMALQEPKFDYGRYSRDIDKLTAQLEKEPCDRAKIVQLTDKMLSAGDNRGSLTRAQQFFDRCGELLRLRWITYEAHKRLSEFDLAVKDATMLIDDRPEDADFRWWRGMAYELAGQWDKAAADYRQCIANKPRITRIPFNLARMYEKMDQPCEGIFPIEQFLYYHPKSWSDLKVKKQLDRLKSNPRCSAVTTRGKAKIRFDAESGIIRAPVELNGKAHASLILDTGATYVVLSRALAEEAGVKIDEDHRILVATAGGLREAYLVTLESVKVQGIEAKNIPAVVQDDLPEGMIGLLGLSFLARHTIDIDRAKGVALLEAR